MSSNPRDIASGWEALLKWDPNAKRIEKQKNGVANDVWLVEIHGQRAIARLGKRSDADLDWETKLLSFLGANGIRVPAPIPNLDGKLFANGLVVMEYLEGTKPQTEADWRRVAETLKKVHALTRNWPQRPGWKSSADLITETKGTKVDLTQMPAEGVTRCRNAWRKLNGTPQSVIHGDPNAGNILMTKDAVSLIDWDESHFDYCALDHSLPHNAANLPEAELAIIKQASAAWEAAVCWGDDYAKKRLAEVDVKLLQQNSHLSSLSAKFD